MHCSLPRIITVFLAIQLRSLHYTAVKYLFRPVVHGEGFELAVPTMNNAFALLYQQSKHTAHSFYFFNILEEAVTR